MAKSNNVNGNFGNPIDAFAAAGSGDNLRKFSDELINHFKHKVLEIYIGDQCETLNFEEYSVPQNCIIYGTLVDVLDRFIILDCFYVDEKTREVKNGNLVYLNQFQIRAMTELNNKGCLNDIFLDQKSSEKIKKTVLGKK